MHKPFTIANRFKQIILQHAHPSIINKQRPTDNSNMPLHNNILRIKKIPVIHKQEIKRS